jgi:hypothetical protein
MKFKPGKFYTYEPWIESFQEFNTIDEADEYASKLKLSVPMAPIAVFFGLFFYENN